MLPNVTASCCNICSGRCFLFAWHYSLHPSTLVFTGEADGKSGGFALGMNADGVLHDALPWTTTRLERTQTSAVSICTERRSSSGGEVKSCFLSLLSAPVNNTSVTLTQRTERALGALVRVSCPAEGTTIETPVLCLTLDNDPCLPFLHGGSRCFVVVASSWRHVRADEHLPSIPRHSLRRGFVSSSRLGPRPRAAGPRLSVRVWSGAKGWGVPEGLDNSRGRQKKASGCLAVDFLWCGWGRGCC